MLNQKSSIKSNKVIKDCIYGHITIPELCLKFMDVPEFQRLKRVRQLGMAHYVYPSAVHTRFEHSLGVMHLAGKMVDQLRKFVNIDDRTKELIQLAGMYHDIGHFAFSHLFDTFLSSAKLDESSINEIFKLKDHEDRSIYFLRQVNLLLNLLSEEEQKFVGNVIKGHVPPEKPAYLYQIVCNEECKIDVDKMDYLKRDSYHTGLPGFQSDYIILNSLINEDGYLAFKRKAENDIIDLFETRKRMFNNVYRHHTTLKIDKIYLCMMKQLGANLYIYGDRTDDFNIEVLIRDTDLLTELVQCIDNRNLNHECSYCKEYQITKYVKDSDPFDKIKFV